MAETLAVNGGTPAIVPPLPLPGHGASMIGEEEKQAAIDVLNRGTLSKYFPPLDATYGWKFEREFSKYLDVKYTLAVTNGTVALQLGLWGLDIGVGDEVLIPTVSWIGVTSAVVSVGAIPVPVELDDSLCISAEAIKNAITPRTKAIIVVHYHGHVADIENIVKIAREHNLYVIEDTAQTVGGRHSNGKALGSFGDIGTFSFNTQKLMSCGEGGMIATNDVKIFSKVAVIMGLNNMYNNRFPEMRAHTLDEKGWHIGVPLNYRLSELLCAVGYAEFMKLEKHQLQPIKNNHDVILKGIADLEGKYGWRFNRSNDAEGGVPYEIMFVFDAPEQAGAFVKALNAEGATNVRPLNVFGFWGPAQTGFVGVVMAEKLFDAMTYYSCFLHSGRHPQQQQRLGITSKLNPWKLAQAVNPEGGEVSMEEVNKRAAHSQHQLDRRVGMSINPLLTPEHCQGLINAVRKVTLGLAPKTA